MKRSLSIEILLLGFLAFSVFGFLGCVTYSKHEFEKLFDPNSTLNKTYDYFGKGKTYPFQSQAKTPNKVNVAWLADASLLAYNRNEEFVKGELEKAGFKAEFFKEKEHGDKGTQGFFASNQEAIFLTFRGTEAEERLDVLRDADFSPAPEGGGKVHHGFQSGLDAVWPEVKVRLKELTASGDRSVWFTGHSLGAAMAVIAAGRWKTEHPKQVVSLYTFGSPGVGNQDFIVAYPDVTVVRVVDNEDQIAKTEGKGLCLFNWCFFDVQHPGGVTIKYIRPSKMFSTKLHDSSWDGLFDHAPIYYAENSWRQVIEEDR